MEALLPIIIQLVTGAIGGLGVGAAFKQAAMSAAVKIISGAIGGVAGGQILTNVLTDPNVQGALSGAWVMALAVSSVAAC